MGSFMKWLVIVVVAGGLCVMLFSGKNIVLTPWPQPKAHLR